MKQYECVEVQHHRDVGTTIALYQKEGWHLYDYSAASMGSGPIGYRVNHYLLFESEDIRESATNKAGDS